MSTNSKVLITTLVLLFLFWNPVTRHLILLVLPLGSGVDDLVFLVLIGVAFVLAFVRGWVAIPGIFDSRKRK